MAKTSVTNEDLIRAAFRDLNPTLVFRDCHGRAISVNCLDYVHGDDAPVKVDLQILGDALWSGRLDYGFGNKRATKL